MQLVLNLNLQDFNHSTIQPQVRGTMIYDLKGLESFPTVPCVDGVLNSGNIQPNNGVVKTIFGKGMTIEV